MSPSRTRNHHCPRPPHTQIRTGRTITSGSYLTLGHYANPLQRVQAKPVRRACIAKADAWPRQALDALVVGIRGKNVNWLVDANICGYYDTIDQEKLIDLIAEEISDDRVLEQVRDIPMLGVIKGGYWQPTLTGVPQGAVTSPL